MKTQQIGLLAIAFASWSSSALAVDGMHLRFSLAGNALDVIDSSFGAEGTSADIRRTRLNEADQFSVALGRPMFGMRTEVEFFHQFDTRIVDNDEAQVASEGGATTPVKLFGNVAVSGLLFNGYLDFADSADQRLVPWVSLGIGLSYLNTRDVAVSASDDVVAFSSGRETDFAWRAGLGFGWALSSATTLDAGVYRFDYGRAKAGKNGFSTGVDEPVTLDNPISFDVRGLSFSMGVRRAL
jgi:opacity protein-like surface antigen